MMIIQLHDNIYIRRHTKYISAERLVNVLKQTNVRLVLNIAPHADRKFLEAARAAGITYDHAPLSDNCYVPEHEVKLLVQKVVTEIDRGNSVMIHCNQGRNRSPLIAILAIIELTDGNPIEALRRAREVQPTILKNKCFERYVKRLRWIP